MTKPIIALDFPSPQDALHFLDGFPKSQSLYLKIGMELYYRGGPDIVQQISARNHEIFLDLKCHDIPNTVEKTMVQIATLGATMTNIHAAGGLAMMQAARSGLDQGAAAANRPRPLLLAVTQLTSTSEEQMHAEQLIPVSLNASILNYARLAQQAGCDGVVCSPLEASMIHDALGAEFLCVTPGIRPSSSQANDQKRAATPAIARRNGSDYIVVGRPITQNSNPLDAYQAIVKEWENN